MGHRVEKVAYVPPGTHPDVPQGHYRHIEDDGDPLAGRLAVWIDEAPGDDEDGSGHFELFDGDAAQYAAAPVQAEVPLEGVMNGAGTTGIEG